MIPAPCRLNIDTGILVLEREREREREGRKES